MCHILEAEADEKNPCVPAEQYECAAGLLHLSKESNQFGNKQGKTKTRDT